jgi:hypothetical protein
MQRLLSGANFRIEETTMSDVVRDEILSLTGAKPSLRAAGNARSEIVTYADTPHAFHADYRPTYRKDQAGGRLEAAAGMVRKVPIVHPSG